MMRRLTVAVAAAAFGFGGLTACSGDDSAEYCDAAESMRTLVEDRQGGEKFQKKLNSQLDKVAEHAPSEIKGDWETFAKASKEISETSSLVKDAGTAEEVNEAQQKAKSAQKKMQSASDKIEKDLEETCGITG